MAANVSSIDGVTAHEKKSIKGITKDYYVSMSSAGSNPTFKWCTFYIPGDACNHVLIHYVGNHEVATEKVTHIWHSVLQTCEKTDELALGFYKGEINSSSYP